jgi:hypothetical protein
MTNFINATQANATKIHFMSFRMTKHHSKDSSRIVEFAKMRIIKEY